MMRRGTGRPTVARGGTVTGVFTLATTHQAMIEAWRARHGCASASAALRQMIEAAEKADAETEPPPGVATS